MAGLPSSMGRVARDRPRLVAVALLALVSLAAAGISATAAERLQSLLDENWRGAYDILVTADGNLSAVDGLLAPNSLSSGDSLALDDVVAIRAVDGVDVAAPIGEVIVAGLSPGIVEISIPKGEAGANEVPQSYRVTMTYRTDDGLGERLVSSETYSVVIDETVRHPKPQEPVTGCTLNGFVIDESYPTLWAESGCGGFGVFGARHPSFVSYPIEGGWSGTDGTDGDFLLFNLGNAPMPFTRITLVDPAAERALLGEAGDFLDPLAQLEPDATTLVEAMTGWAKASPGQFASDFLEQEEQRQAAQLGGPSAEWVAELRRLYEDNGADFNEYLGPPQVYVPLIVSETGAAPLDVRIDVEGFGGTQENSTLGYGYQLPEALLGGSAGIPVGSSEVDISDVLNPFAPTQLRVPWPGTPESVPSDARGYFSMNIYYTAAVVGAAVESLVDAAGSPSVRLSASGYVSAIPDFGTPVGPFDLTASASKTGTEAAYSDVTHLVQPEGGEIAVPVGKFSADDLESLQSPLGYVPLGAYQQVGTTVSPGSNPRVSEAVELNPGVTGLGLVSPRTIAIASIKSAAAWGQEKPVSAVRVRVAGVEGYSAESISRITEVAQAIEKLGFTATIVAGSSPTDVTVQVDDYAFGVTDPEAKQEVGPLGAVNQRWSELGAASRVDLAVSTSSMGVLAVALGASALLLAAVQLASVPGRRAQASVLRAIGWRRRRIVRWMAAEELVSLLIVVVAGLAALILASSRSTVGLSVGASVAALVVTSALAVALGARPVDSGIRSLKRGRRRHRMAEVAAWVVSPLRFALRQVSVHRVNVVVQLLATLVVAVAAAAVTVTVMEGRAAAGASALGLFAVDQALWAQLGLGVVALVAGIVLAVIARRIDLGRRREQWATMRAMGWSAGQVRAVQVIEGLLVGLPAIALAGALSWWYVRELAVHLLGTALPVALGAAAVLTVILVMTSWREKR